MKTAIIVCSVLAIANMVSAVPIKPDEKFCAAEKKCIETLKLDQNHIRAIITDDSTKFLPENDEELNEFLHCHWQAMELQDAKGDLNYEKIVECIYEFPRMNFGGTPNDETPIGLEIALAATEICKNVVKGATHGQTAAKTQNCIDKRMMELVEKENQVL